MNTYIGRFDGTHQAGKAGEHKTTATRWSVLSERIQGLLVEACAVGTGMDDYCIAMSDSEGPAMRAIREKMLRTPWGDEWAEKKTMYSYGEEMSTDLLEAQFLKAVTALKQPRRVLEVGMFAGYGASAMLEGCQSAHVVSLEIDPYLKTWVEECFVPMPAVASRLEIIIGPALDSMAKLPASKPFDLVFVDANKSEYVKYVEILVARGLLAEGAMLVVDNTLYCGIPYTSPALDSQPDRRNFGESIREFNTWVHVHPDFQQVVLPLRDGVSLIMYKPEGLKICDGNGVNTRALKFYETDASSAERLERMAFSMVVAAEAAAAEVGSGNNWVATLSSILHLPAAEKLLLHVSRIRAFSVELQPGFAHNLSLLNNIKKLKYWYVLPQSDFLRVISSTAAALGVNAPELAAQADCALASGAQEPTRVLVRKLDLKVYLGAAEELEITDPHAVYPTSTFRSCDGHVLATNDASHIEAVMSTTLTTTIRIIRGVLDPDCPALRDVYAPLGRCVAIVDKHVYSLHGEKIEAYFAAHGIMLSTLQFRGMEADKGMETVEKILFSLKKEGVSRNEPVLIIGGGVIADVGGFACALYHRNTPYVMLCTSIVSGIDAGPSPRTCCDGNGYKNLFGAYHPPVLTLTDPSLFTTLHPGWLRHGIAEIIKMAVVKDSSLFDLLETAGPRLIETKFGALCQDDKKFSEQCNLIVGKAMHSYVQSEYGNLWETHQCRPHAYGHTWSPGYEIPAGMLHGHAVATGMGWGAFLAQRRGFINVQQLRRILSLISEMELSLWHPIMADAQLVWDTNKKIIQKRGGHLVAPVPKGKIGQCGYIQDLEFDEVKVALKDYEALCSTYPRGGLGIDPHCADVGLEDPATVGERKEGAEIAFLKETNARLQSALDAAENRIVCLNAKLCYPDS